MFFLENLKWRYVIIIRRHVDDDTSRFVNEWLTNNIYHAQEIVLALEVMTNRLLILRRLPL